MDNQALKKNISLFLLIIACLTLAFSLFSILSIQGKIKKTREREENYLTGYNNFKTNHKEPLATESSKHQNEITKLNDQKPFWFILAFTSGVVVLGCLLYRSKFPTTDQSVTKAEVEPEPEEIPSNESTPDESLETLNRLLEKSLITQSEYDAKKSDILNKL